VAAEWGEYQAEYRELLALEQARPSERPGRCAGLAAPAADCIACAIVWHSAWGTRHPLQPPGASSARASVGAPGVSPAHCSWIRVRVRVKKPARLTPRRRRARRRSARTPSAGSSATSASWPSCARPRRRRCRARRRPCAAGASALPRCRRSRACWAACTPRWPRARVSRGRGRGAAPRCPARQAGACGLRACTRGGCAPASPACAPHALRPEPRRRPCDRTGVWFKWPEMRG
jgi:hypothetical protein